MPQIRLVLDRCSDSLRLAQDRFMGKHQAAIPALSQTLLPVDRRQ